MKSARPDEGIPCLLFIRPPDIRARPNSPIRGYKPLPHTVKRFTVTEGEGTLADDFYPQRASHVFSQPFALRALATSCILCTSGENKLFIIIFRPSRTSGVRGIAQGGDGPAVTSITA